MWYRPITPYIPGRPVPPLHGIYLITHVVSANHAIYTWSARTTFAWYGIYLITHVVSADHTIYTWSAGTTFAWYIFNHTCGIGRSCNIYLVSRYHMYIIYFTISHTVYY